MPHRTSYKRCLQCLGQHETISFNISYSISSSSMPSGLLEKKNMNHMSAMSVARAIEQSQSSLMWPWWSVFNDLYILMQFMAHFWLASENDSLPSHNASTAWFSPLGSTFWCFLSGLPWTPISLSGLPLPCTLTDHAQDMLKLSCLGTVDWTDKGQWIWTGYELGRYDYIFCWLGAGMPLTVSRRKALLGKEANLWIWVSADRSSFCKKKIWCNV